MLVVVPVLLLLQMAADWPQFRGPNASGIGDTTNLPVEIGPSSKHVVWRTALPGGYSSPSIAGDRIFITAVDNDRLFTFAMERKTGKILWRRECPRPRSAVHRS